MQDSPAECQRGMYPCQVQLYPLYTCSYFVFVLDFQEITTYHLSIFATYPISRLDYFSPSFSYADIALVSVYQSVLMNITFSTIFSQYSVSYVVSLVMLSICDI